MKLELLSLRAVNCGPLKDVIIDFSDGNGHARPITLLAGANGSGKTTVLELIAALAESLIDGFDWKKSILFRCGYVQADFRINYESFSLYSGTAPDDVNISGQKFGIVPGFGKGLSFAAEKQVVGNVAGDLRNAIKLSAISDLDLEAPVERDQTERAPAFIYLPHMREIRYTQGEKMNREYTKYEWVHRFKSNTVFSGSIDSYLVWLEYAEPQVFQRVVEFLNNLYPGKHFKIERRQLRSLVVTSGREHPIDKLSSGEQNILIVLLELYRYLTPNSIVLIDEIENSLHPAFQHRMAQGLLQLQREVSFQLIVTSHSEDIYKVFGSQSTLVLPMPQNA